jgi:hypothetical protein
MTTGIRPARTSLKEASRSACLRVDTHHDVVVYGRDGKTGEKLKR